MTINPVKIAYGFGFTALAVGIGLLVAMAIASDPEENNNPPIFDVKFTSPVDHNWGKLPSRVANAKFKQVVIGWKGSKGVKLKDENRTHEEAKELIEQVWHLYHNDPTQAQFARIQGGFNEDPKGDDEVYLAYSNAPLEDPIRHTAQSTKKKHARIVESSYGFHLIRREEQ